MRWLDRLIDTIQRISSVVRKWRYGHERAKSAKQFIDPEKYQCQCTPPKPTIHTVYGDCIGH
jgi:hypothetical protein